MMDGSRSHQRARKQVVGALFLALAAAGCSSVDSDAAADRALVQTWQYETKTDDFEGVTISRAMQWYPMPNWKDDINFGDLYVAFACEQKKGPDAYQTLKLQIASAPKEEPGRAKGENVRYIVSAKAKFDEGATFDITDQAYREDGHAMTVQPFPDLVEKGMLRAREMRLRVTHGWKALSENGSSEFDQTVDVAVGLNGDSIKHVLRDCADYLGQGRESVPKGGT